MQSRDSCQAIGRKVRIIHYREGLYPSGNITEFPLPLANSFPSSITAGSDGNLWFTIIGTNNGPSQIGVITTQGNIHEFTFPHSIFGSITRGPDGNLWFTAFQYSATGATTGKIESITTAGKLSDFPLPITSYVPTSITWSSYRIRWIIRQASAYPFSTDFFVILLKGQVAASS